MLALRMALGALLVSCVVPREDAEVTGRRLGKDSVLLERSRLTTVVTSLRSSLLAFSGLACMLSCCWCHTRRLMSVQLRS